VADTRIPRWRFARVAPSQPNQNPIQGEFFTSVSDLPERLVRESIQNSLDARRGSETVRVRFALNRAARLDAATASAYVRGLQPHMKAVAQAELESAESAAGEQQALAAAYGLLGQPMDYLVVEDFGTTGLAGSVEDNSEYEDRNAFWGFFRSIGISPKHSNDGGSWGLGKWVFPDASRINAFIGLTRRSGERSSLLMGQAMLKTHTIDGSEGPAKYPPYGYFAAPSDLRDDQWLPLPVDEREAAAPIARVAADFKLQRGAEPGLSVIVPYPQKELSPESIARAVVVQWFLPILRGDLEVTIESPGRQQVISDQTIDGIIGALPESGGEISRLRGDETQESLRGLLQLARWALRVDSAEYITGVELWTSAAKDAAPISDALRARFDRGERLAFVLSRRVRKQGQALKDAALSHFRLYLERDDNLSEGHDYFVRGHLRIPQMDHIKRHRVRALVVVDSHTPLAHLLRDAEGPAHARWDPHADRLKRRWSGGYERVQNVRRAAALLIQQLTKRPEGRQLDVLARFFPDRLTDETRRSGNGRKPGPGKPPKPVVPPLRRLPLEITRRADGFMLRRTAAPPTDVQSKAAAVWDVRFAYDVASKNAFSEFAKGVRDKAPDFSLRNGMLTVSVEHGAYEIHEHHHNVLRVSDYGAGFRLTVSGFDGRDVLVDVQAVTEGEARSGGAAA